MENPLINEITNELKHTEPIVTKPADANVFLEGHDLADNIVTVTCKKFLKPTDVAELRTEIAKQFAHLIQITEFLFNEGGLQ